MMKFLLASLISLSAFLQAPWETDFEKAKATAAAEHKYILLNFSGSDWCGPCIRMRKDIFDSEVFGLYAKEKLVLLNADFPRLKKNGLSKEQQAKNDALAERYNRQGIFPLTILLTPEGKPVKTWEGLPPLSAEAFTRELQGIVHASQ